MPRITAQMDAKNKEIAKVMLDSPGHFISVRHIAHKTEYSDTTVAGRLQGSFAWAGLAVSKKTGTYTSWKIPPNRIEIVLELMT